MYYNYLPSLMSNRYLKSWMDSSGWDQFAETRPWSTPACDVEEFKEHYLLSFDLPGVSKEQIQIEAKDGKLRVAGERKQEREIGEGEYRYAERFSGKFERTFSLPEGVHLEKIEAQFDNGVLRIVIPKVEAVKPIQIRINQQPQSNLWSRLTKKAPETHVA